LGCHSDTVGLILNEFFELREDGWHKDRCDLEIDLYHNKADKNKENGKKGGRPKKINELDDNPEITQMVSKNNPNITLTINHKPITNNQLKDIPPQAEESEKAITNQLVVEKKSRATRLPSDWIPSQEYFDELANIDEKLKPKFNIIAATFRDYWVSKSGNDATKTDWLATWRNWVRREAEKNAKSIGSNKSSFHERRADLTEAVTDYERATRF
jgi:uncharacterized protein YdaU (DUF1376 family)